MVGIDEVGRGCWAGPLLVVAARATEDLPKGLTDSKLLTRQKRETIYHLLITNIQLGEGWVSAVEIDKYGLAEAMRLGVARALGNLGVLDNELIVMDGKVNYLPSKFTNTECIIDADLNISIVSAASIYAKVTRDKFMHELGLEHPKYGFENHVGYGTKAHRLALEQNGTIKGIHRMSFKPIAEIAGNSL